MKVFIIRNPAAEFGCELFEGETGTVSDDLGNLLVSKGIAKCLDKLPKETVKTVSQSPAIAEAKPPAITPDVPEKEPAKASSAPAKQQRKQFKRKDA